jgi:hypothetical protein
MTAPSRSIRSGDLDRVPLGDQRVPLALAEHVLQLVGGGAEVAALHVPDEDRVAARRVMKPTGGTFPVTSAFSDDVVPCAM